MQRILSVELSRSDTASSEFVTKRLCCSIILTVAFFSVIGGFFLGRFVANQSTVQLQNNYKEVCGKVNALNVNLQNAFRSGLNKTANQNNCNENTFSKCNFLEIGQNSSGQLAVTDYLRTLNSCFSNG